MWYLDMEITSDLRIHRDGRVPFQWLEQQDDWWGHELREHVRQSLVADVQTRDQRAARPKRHAGLDDSIGF